MTYSYLFLDPFPMPDRQIFTPSTPFPSHLIDTVMPRLKDTEWRLLCVVVRATLGWQAANSSGRKEADWLTHRQLKTRTGRSSEAVSRAIDTLVRRGLLQVHDEAGTLLATPAARRRHAGRLLFSLSPVTTGREGSLPLEEASLKSEDDRTKTEIAKPKTTKESDDKKTPYVVSFSSDGEANARELLAEYCRLFAAQSARGEPPPISWGKEGRLAKQLLAQYPYDRLVELLHRFFQSEDAWVKQRGYALSTFPTLLPRLLMKDARKVTKLQAAIDSPLTIHSPGAPWYTAADAQSSKVSLFERYPDLAGKRRD